MTTVQSADVLRMAKLARIALTPEETALFEGDLRKILDYMDILKTVNVEGVSPTAHVNGSSNVLREDLHVESGMNEALLAQTPALVEDVLVKVPAVLPGEGMA